MTGHDPCRAGWRRPGPADPKICANAAVEVLAHERYDGETRGFESPAACSGWKDVTMTSKTSANVNVTSGWCQSVCEPSRDANSSTATRNGSAALSNSSGSVPFAM